MDIALSHDGSVKARGLEWAGCELRDDLCGDGRRGGGWPLSAAAIEAAAALWPLVSGGLAAGGRLGLGGLGTSSSLSLSPYTTRLSKGKDMQYTVLLAAAAAVDVVGASSGSFEADRISNSSEPSGK